EKDGVGDSSMAGPTLSRISPEPNHEPPPDWPANLPVEWASVRGSGLYTAREVRTTEDLNNAIVEDGLLKLFGADAVESIFGYGSYEFFRNGRPEDIRFWDADKKPDYIIIGDNRSMIKNLARHWNLTAEQTAALQEHAVFSRRGLREGFVFFNTDI